MTTTAAKKAPAKKVAAAPPSPEAPTFDPAAKITTLKPHPANPRRTTVADPDMVASIREHGVLEPLVVGPGPKAGEFTVVMGNRRLDGSKRADRKTAPILIRHDLDTPEKQLEVAIVENLHRENLTAIEEAEAFEQLRGMGYTQKRISERTGCPSGIVRDRLKLLKLQPRAQDRLHVGQLSIGDALAVLEFTDGTVQAALLEVAGTPQFAGAVERARRLETARKRVAEEVAQLKAEGVTQLDMNGKQLWQLTDYVNGPVEIAHLTRALTERSAHGECLAFTITPDLFEGVKVAVLCTAPAAHLETPSTPASGGSGIAGGAPTPGGGTFETDQAAIAERQREEADRAAKYAAWRGSRAVSRKLRPSTAMGHLKPGLKLDAAFLDLMRALLPALIFNSEYGNDAYQDLMGIADEDRWENFDEDPANAARMRAHAQDLADASPYRIAMALTALTVREVESNVEGNIAADSVYPSWDAAPLVTAGRYFELLEALSYARTEVDDAVVERLTEAAERAAAVQDGGE